MSETHINAYVAELVIAEQDLSRAQARVDELKSFIEANSPVEELTGDASESAEDAPKKPKSSKKKGK